MFNLHGALILLESGWEPHWQGASFQNSRTFQGPSKILTEIQGLFKDRHEIHDQEFKEFFQGCGNPVNLTDDSSPEYHNKYNNMITCASCSRLVWRSLSLFVLPILASLY